MGETVDAAVVGVVGHAGGGAAFGHDVGGIVFVGEGAGRVLGWEDIDVAVAGGGGGRGGCCGGHYFFFGLSFRGRIVLLLERKDRREDL